MRRAGQVLLVSPEGGGSGEGDAEADDELGGPEEANARWATADPGELADSDDHDDSCGCRREQPGRPRDDSAADGGQLGDVGAE
jgi:hypothetical protein